MIACIVILLILLTISPILWWIYEVIKYEYKRKFQFLMFNQIEKGDYVWKLVGANITPIKVESVSYGFDKNNNITKIRLYFDSRWDSITILPDSARTFKIENGDGEYYTIFEHAEAKRLFTEIKRIKSRNDLLINTDEDIKIAIHEELKNIEELKKQVKEFKKKMS
jgi:hypothetical protein